MTFKFRTQSNPVKISLPSRPRLSSEDPESLSGEVQGMSASAPEERMARALDKANIQYIFRYTVGAPRGLPGWKEVDFIVLSKGMVYAQEVDTAFTHRSKGVQDVLHDAIILNDRELQSVGQLYPNVFHADGDSDLADRLSAEQYVKRIYGK